MIAYFIARQSFSYAPTPTPLAKIIMQAHHGIINTAEKRAEVAEALMEGQDFRIDMKKRNGRNDAENKRWQDRDSANALADDFRRKVLRLLKKLPVPRDDVAATSDQHDARWLSLMVAAWRLAIGVYSYQGDPFAVAAGLAAKANESDYFRDVIAPQFVAHSFLRAPEEERSLLLARINSE
jgi:hypothetical protein